MKKNEKIIIAGAGAAAIVYLASQAGATPPPGGCTPDWQVDGWGVCKDGIQRRSVIDANNCGVSVGRPSDSRSCYVSPPPGECTPQWICETPLNGYEEDVECGTPRRLNAICQPSPKTGSALIKIEQTGIRARVIIDGVDTYKYTPYNAINLSTGIHTYKLIPDGYYQPVEGTFNVIESQSVGVLVNLSCNAPFPYPIIGGWSACNSSGYKYRTVDDGCTGQHEEVESCDTGVTIRSWEINVQVPTPSWQTIKSDLRGSVRTTDDGRMLWTFSGLGMIINYGPPTSEPATWINQATGFEEIAVISDGIVYFNIGLHEGNADFTAPLSDVTILSQLPGKTTQLEYNGGT